MLKLEEHKYFMEKAFEMKKFSDDPRTQTGAIIVSPVTKKIVVCGSNMLPKGIKLTPELKKVLETDAKYEWIEHAERSCIEKASAQGKNTTNCYMYVTYAPCAPCGRAIINAGIKKVIAPAYPDFSHKKWGESWRIAMKMFEKAKVEFIVITK
jgi:deoxycytidylate deaminase